MSYQSSLKNPPMEFKKPNDSCQQIKDKAKNQSDKIVE